MKLPSNVISALFDQVKDATYFAKDKDGNFLACNKLLVSILKRPDESEVIGKSDFDFFPKHIAEGYRRDDEEVMDSQSPKLNIVELIPNKEGKLEWYITHKYPLFDDKGKCHGITGICLKTDTSSLVNIYPSALTDVLEYISKNYSNPIRIKELAEISKQSERTLERIFKKTFNQTITAYISETRINAVSHLINNSSMTLSEIAQACGFCDQSYMTKEFKKQLGITPKAYSMQLRR